MSVTTAGPAPAQLTVVHTSACHFCSDAAAALADLATDFALAVELVGADEPRGVTLMAAHRAAMYPLVLVDGVFFSSGRLPRKKLRKLLETRATAAVS